MRIEWHLTQVLAGYQFGETPVGVELVEAVLSRYSEDMDATINRQEYGLRKPVQNFDAKPAEIKALLVNGLIRLVQSSSEIAWVWRDCRSESGAVGNQVQKMSVLTLVAELN